MSKKTFNCFTTYKHSSGYRANEHTAPRRTSQADRHHSDDEWLPGTNTCTRSAYQNATVNVPVAIRPTSFAGRSKIVCCSDPVIKGIRRKKHRDEQICYFTISQEICVEVPVHFGAEACIGQSWVECHDVSTDECDEE